MLANTARKSSQAVKLLEATLAKLTATKMKFIVKDKRPEKVGLTTEQYYNKLNQFSKLEKE